MYLHAFFYKDNDKPGTAPVVIIITPGCLVTVSDRPLAFMDSFKDKKIEFYTTQKTKLLILIFSQINSAYSSYLTDVYRQVRKIMAEPGNVNNKDIIKLVQFEEILNSFVADLTPTSAILRRLLSGKILRLYEEDKELVENIVVSAEQLIELAKSNLKTITNVREAYSTIVSNNLNQVMKVLTVVTVILTIPTIVASLFGMNVTLPLADNPMAFWLIGGVIAFVSGVLVYIFIKNNWL